MRHVIYGAGAIGAGVGGLLAEAGHEVVLIARGAHLAQLQKSGLRMSTPDRTRTISILAVEDPGEIDWTGDQVVHLAVKSGATDEVLSRLSLTAPASTPVVCLQNGVANEARAARWFGTVFGVCVMMPATHLEPGAVELRSAGAPAILDIGRVPGEGAVDPLAERIAADYVSAGIVSLARPDIMAWKHRKLLANLGNAVDACLVPGEAADQVARRLRAEGEEILAAAGIGVVSAEQDRQRRGDLLKLSAGGGSSSWQSLARGTGSIEADWLNGEIVSIAHSIGRTAPLNDAIRRLANRMARDGADPRSADPAVLLD